MAARRGHSSTWEGIRRRSGMKNFKQWFGAGARVVSMGLAAGVIALPAIAQAANVEVGGQVRYRGEYDVLDFNPDTSADFVNTQRSRINVKYNNSRYHGFLQIQDVRVWGQEMSTLNDLDTSVDNNGDRNRQSLDMHQAYLKVDDVLGTGVAAQIGRQEINFADQRLVGAVNWTQNARSLDGLVLSRTFGEGNVVIPFYLQLNEADRTDAVHGSKVVSSVDKDGNIITGDEGHDEDTYVAGFHSAWKVADGHSFQPHVYFVHNGTKGVDLSLYDLGFYYTGTSDAVSYDFTASYQTGTQGPIDISAYLVSGHLFFTSGPLKVGAGVDYLSGDDDATDTDNNSFNTLLATNHKFYGYMDYFTAFGSTGDAVAGLGLIDYQLKSSYAVDKATKVAADLHYFQTAESTDSTGTDVRLAGEDNLGWELDLTAKHKMGPVALQAGYSAFFKDDAMKAKVAPDIAALQQVPVNDASVDNVGYWAYIMASLNF